MGSKEATGKPAEKPVYSYTTSPNTDLEEENRFLKETVTQLKTEIDRIKAPALLVAEVCELSKYENEQHAVIKVPNGNKFLVQIDSRAKGIKPGDTVLVEQKNLVIVSKLASLAGSYNVEKFVIIEKYYIIKD